MANQNVLVTGGTGYIGSHTVVELAAAGYRPVIVDDFSNSSPDTVERIESLVGSKIKIYRGDFADKQLLSKIFAAEAIDGVVHFAAYKAVGESVQQPLKYYKNNVAGLISLLEILEKNKVPTFVFSSSCTVYGQPDKLPLVEASPLKSAVSPYGASKQMCERIIQDTSKVSNNLKALSLRYFNPIGAHQSAEIGELPLGVPANLIPFVTQTAIGLRQKLTIYGDDYPTPDGTCIRDYIHVVDLAKAHVKALQYLAQQKPKFYDVFNIGTAQGNSVLQVIKTFEKVNHQKIAYSIGPRRAGDVAVTYAAVDKAHRVLGWKAEKSLADALIDAWHWQQTLAK